MNDSGRVAAGLNDPSFDKSRSSPETSEMRGSSDPRSDYPESSRDEGQ